MSLFDRQISGSFLQFYSLLWGEKQSERSLEIPPRLGYLDHVALKIELLSSQLKSSIDPSLLAAADKECLLAQVWQTVIKV